MELTVLEATAEHIRAGYDCPCGCSPAVEYSRAADLVEEGCCCGNHFAVGPGASASLTRRAGFRPESQEFDAPWGERLEAAWLVGLSVHGPGSGHDEHEHAAPEVAAAGEAATHDPVCGMTVEPENARAKGLHSLYNGADFYFCGKGCKLEFDEDPERYLDPAYVPSM